MPVSTAPTVKETLRTGLLARAGLAGAQVTWDRPSQKLRRDLVYLGTIESAEGWAAIGGKRREENFTLSIEVSVVRAFADDPATTAQRAFAVLGEITEHLRADPTLGIAGLIAAQVGGWTHVADADSEAGWREARITTRIAVRARI